MNHATLIHGRTQMKSNQKQRDTAKIPQPTENTKERVEGRTSVLSPSVEERLVIISNTTDKNVVLPSFEVTQT